MELDKHSTLCTYDTPVDGNPTCNIDGNSEKENQILNSRLMVDDDSILYLTCLNTLYTYFYIFY
jgi:hypothetical protein